MDSDYKAYTLDWSRVSEICRYILLLEDTTALLNLATWLFFLSFAVAIDFKFSMFSCLQTAMPDSWVPAANGFFAPNDHLLFSNTDPANAREMLEYLLNQPANKFCADCGIPDPKWA